LEPARVNSLQRNRGATGVRSFRRRCTGKTRTIFDTACVRQRPDSAVRNRFNSRAHTKEDNHVYRRRNSWHPPHRLSDRLPRPQDVTPIIGRCHLATCGAPLMGALSTAFERTSLGARHPTPRRPPRVARPALRRYRARASKGRSAEFDPRLGACEPPLRPPSFIRDSARLRFAQVRRLRGHGPHQMELVMT
jgi:hypothetical protein